MLTLERERFTGTVVVIGTPFGLLIVLLVYGHINAPSSVC